MKTWKRRSLNMDHITAGVCYYPEYWGKDYWKSDLEKMRELGIEVVRIAESSWNFFEPEEGRYDFTLFDTFIDEAKYYGIRIIIGTPTYTPPAWLTKKYPEVLNADISGNLFHHGMRQHRNLTSKIYLEKCAKLVSEMAKHFSKQPMVIGWQLDNEINCEVSEYYAKSDREAFRRWIKTKYTSLEAFNHAIGGVFWNQSYSSWDEVELPQLTHKNSPNPHMVLEMRRFVSHSAIQFLKNQSDRIREYIPQDTFIMTNGVFNYFDYNQLIEEGVVDFITYDSYPNFAFSPGKDISGDDINDRNTSYNLAKVRSNSPIFGIMEQQVGAGGWNTRLMQTAPKPGQMRLWSFQSIAHGADFI
ncbi:MAG: beta-galactosidase, partial [Suipraeoptans sp.]